MTSEPAVRTVQVPLNGLGDFRTVRLGPGERLCRVCRGTGISTLVSKMVVFPKQEFVCNDECERCEGTGKESNDQNN